MVGIDWCTVKVPVAVPVEFGDRFLRVTREGVVAWEKDLAQQVAPSWSQSVQVRPDTMIVGEQLMPAAWVSGNPSKWLQGHGLWSHTGPELVTEWVRSVLEMVGSSPAPGTEALWQVSRVDVCRMFSLDSLGDVRRWLGAANHYARSRHKSGSVMRGETLYFGLGSREWMVRAYAKGQEMLTHAPDDEVKPDWWDPLTAWAQRMLRVEVVVRRRELARRGLDVFGAWTADAWALLWSDLWGRIEVSDMVVDSRVEADLPARLAGVLELWRKGDDIRSRVSRATFYRYRRELMDLGLPDICLESPQGPLPAVKVALREVLEAVPAVVPATFEHLTWRPAAA